MQRAWPERNYCNTEKLGLLVKGLYEGEALATRLPLVPIFVTPKGQHAFASDHFKVAFLVWGLEKAAVDSHCQRTVRRREPIPAE